MYSKMVLQDQIETLDETKNDGTDSTATTGDSTVSVSGITGNDAAKTVVIVRAPFCSWNGCIFFGIFGHDGVKTVLMVVSVIVENTVGWSSSVYSKMLLQDQIETPGETKNDGTDSTATTGDGRDICNKQIPRSK